MPFQTITLDHPAKRAALWISIIAVVVAAYFVGKWSFASMASSRTDLTEIADLSTALAPDDPSVHLQAAYLFEKTFMPEDFERSLNEYEMAAALSPANFKSWLDLGKARERRGDRVGAEAALRKALELAPNYAAAQWALGNTLLRQGDENEAFTQLRKAVSADPALAVPTVRGAMQFFGGDLTATRDSVGQSPDIDAALIMQLLQEKRSDDAFAVWSSGPPGDQAGPKKDASDRLLLDLVAAKRFGQAFRIYSANIGRNSREVAPGEISNGGFEQDIKAENAPVFEWQIAVGQQPQIALTDGQKHSGARSLILVFNASVSSEFRPVSQVVWVEPGSHYVFSAFFKSDLKTDSTAKWEIVNAESGQPIAETDRLPERSDWSAVNVSFVVPAGTDGVIIRLIRDRCPSTICPVSGRLWLDDITITAN